jgi:transcription elongation factor GreB
MPVDQSEFRSGSKSRSVDLSARRSAHYPSRMSKSLRKPDAEAAQPGGIKNYITPGGLQRLKDEERFLLTRERRAVTAVVAWAASNGDRSENADYQYNKRRLRQIDRRIRFLGKRIEAAEVVDPEAPRRGRAATHVFFGATVRYASAAGTERVVSVVGLDEVDLARSHISWVSPLARALMKSGPGDCVVLRAPGTTEQLQILDVCYERIAVDPFVEPPGAESAPRSRSRSVRPGRT